MKTADREQKDEEQEEKEEDESSCCCWLAGGGDGGGNHPCRSAPHSRHNVGRRNNNWEFRVNMYPEFRFEIVCTIVIDQFDAFLDRILTFCYRYRHNLVLNVQSCLCSFILDWQEKFYWEFIENYLAIYRQGLLHYQSVSN